MKKDDSNEHKLLSREEFKQKVFARDKHICLFCPQPCVDAHHILDRKLWTDGGNYLSNGASVCNQCHLKCEQTLISVEQIRTKANILVPIIPKGLSLDTVYDKWANVILPDGTRKRGPIWDSGVRKVLASAGLLGLFVDLYD